MPLIIEIEGEELFNPVTYEFTNIEPTILTLEHSLISISKWEAKWKKPWLDEYTEKTEEETLDYIRCMLIKGNLTDEVLNNLSKQNMLEIMSYIKDPMTASTIRQDDDIQGVPKNFTTSELIYSWMVGYQIPFECEKWHLNRLLTLIRILDANNKSSSNKKTSEADLIRKYAKMNAANKAKLNAAKGH